MLVYVAKIPQPQNKIYSKFQDISAAAVAEAKDEVGGAGTTEDEEQKNEQVEQQQSSRDEERHHWSGTLRSGCWHRGVSGA